MYIFECRSSCQPIRTVSTGYALCSLFVPGDKHAIIGTKVLQLFEKKKMYLFSRKKNFTENSYAPAAWEYLWQEKLGGKTYTRWLK